MASTNNKTAKKKSFLARVADWFKRLPKRIAKSFSNMWHELRKVSWPTRKQLWNYTLVVLAFMVFMGVVIGVLDTLATQLIKAIS